MAAPTSGLKPGQSVSVTSWPSEAHSRAACSAAATQSGWPRSPSGVRVVKPIRSRPGSAPTSAPNGRVGGGAQYGSPRSGPDVASSSAALSRTDRVSACSTAAPAATSPYSGPSGLRARVGLRANSPHADAGYRSEPPRSLPWANGTMPAATAAADPPLDPLVDSRVSQGLRVAPNSAGSHAGAMPNSGVLVLPSTTRPALRSRMTSSASKQDTLPARNRDPSVKRTPFISQ